MHPSGQQPNEGETAGVITRPPLLFLAALLLGFVLERLAPSAFALSGCYLIHWTVRRFSDLHRSGAGSCGYSRLLPGGNTSTYERAHPCAGYDRYS
jgi:hypothetical protein